MEPMDTAGFLIGMLATIGGLAIVYVMITVIVQELARHWTRARINEARKIAKESTSWQSEDESKGDDPSTTGNVHGK